MANRNSCRVARLVGVLTQGSVLRPQPWAGESQLRQSCCCLGNAPSQTLPKGRELIPAMFEAVGCCSFPLGKAGMGLLLGLLCQCFGVDVVEHQTTDGEPVDGGDVDH